VIRHAKIRFAIAAGAGAVAVALPGAGEASSGGGAMSPSGGASPSSSVPTQPGNVVVTASGDGITIATRASALLRSGLQFSGSVSSRYAGDTVEIERAGPRTNGAWVGTTQGTVASDGTFTALWQTNHIGRFAVKAILTAPGGAAAASSSGGPTVTVTVYRPSVATLYGPGFWGRRTACGVVLRRYTVGVANRTLPCGTPVAVYYRGRTMVLPVIDRGPYAHAAEWDLTMAAGRALGVNTTVMIGAVSLPRTG